MTLTIQDFFNHPWKQNSFFYKSTYISVLIESRKLTGRNIRTGNKLKKSHASWLGNLGYMIIIDLLADVVNISLKPSQGEYTNNSIKFMRQFFNLSYNDACSLYALRCAFAHDFGLKNLHKRAELNKKFSVTQGSNILIYHDTNRNIYIVDLEKFADLIEDFHYKVKSNKFIITANITNDLFLKHR